MLRVIFDTNIYGLIIKEEEYEKIKKKLKDDKNLIIYGFKPIRKELRNTPKYLKLGRLKTRNLLLNLYDDLIKEKYLGDIEEIDKLAKKFYNLYRKLGGIRNWKKTNINIDFIIVAFACFYKLDLVISEDAKTLLNPNSQKAVNLICKQEKLWLPNFWKYSDLKKKYNF